MVKKMNIEKIKKMKKSKMTREEVVNQYYRDVENDEHITKMYYQLTFNDGASTNYLTLFDVINNKKIYIDYRPDGENELANIAKYKLDGKYWLTVSNELELGFGVCDLMQIGKKENKQNNDISYYRHLMSKEDADALTKAQNELYQFENKQTEEINKIYNYYQTFIDEMHNKIDDLKVKNEPMITELNDNLDNIINDFNEKYKQQINIEKKEKQNAKKQVNNILDNLTTAELEALLKQLNK